MEISEAYRILSTVFLIVIGCCLLAVIIKSVIGPRISDRLMSVNMVGTLVTSAICILSGVQNGESYLSDVAIIYVCISFLSVVVFTEVYINEYLQKKSQKKEEKK